MATPVHYIRTIHTSFTAAHPHSSSAWASSSASVARTHSHANILLSLSSSYNQAPASRYPPGLGTTTGRKRSASVRVAPPAYAAQRLQSQRVKFDPFAEEPESIPPASSVLYNTPSARSVVTRPASMPYTIQIPPAAPADIQRHQQQQLQYRQQQQQRSSSPQPMRVHRHQQQPPQQQAPVQRVPTPAVVSTPAVPTHTNAANERDARSKIVAGILLNRVHAVGKPMRRRASDQPRPYVPSGLSTCIATEA